MVRSYAVRSLGDPGAVLAVDEEPRLPYVMAVACGETVSMLAGSFRADELSDLVPSGRGRG